MITVSTAVATALEQPSRQIDVKLYVNNSALDVDVMSLKMYKGACGQFTVGSVFVPYLEMTLNGDVDIDEFEVRVSVAVNGAFSTYYTVGWFKATSIEKKTEQTEVYAQGKLAFATEKINPSGRTLQNILSAVREHYTVDIKNLTIPSASIPELIPITDFTCRDALELIAVCSGGYVSETYNGHLVLGGFKNSTVAGTITEDRLTEQPIIKGEYELTGIDVKVSEALTYHIPNETAVKNFEISNPYFNGDMAQTFSSNTIGHSFNVANVKVAMGDFRFEPFDLIEVVKGDLGLLPSDTLYPSDNLYPSDGTNESFTVPCYNITLTFDGGLQSEFNAEGELPTEKETKTGGAISSKLNEAYEKAIAANNLASQASKDASSAHDMAESAIDGEGTSVSQYYKQQFAYGTSLQRVGAWQDKIPTLTATYPYLYTRTVTMQVTTTYDEETGEHTSTETMVDEGTETKTTLLEGVYTFISGAADGSTTINGGCITTGTIDCNKVNVTNINASNIKSGTLDASQISVTNLNASNITSGALSLYSVSSQPVINIYNSSYSTAVFPSSVTVSSGGVETWIGSDGLHCEDGNETCSIDAIRGYFIGQGIEITAHLKVTNIGSGSGTTCVYNGSNYIVKLSSSKRYKENIKPIELEELNPKQLYDVEVCQFNYKDGQLAEGDERIGQTILGMIAEQVEEVMPIAVVHNEKGETEMWDNMIIVPAMLKLLQEQHKEIEQLKARLN